MSFHKAILMLSILTVIIPIVSKSQNARAQWYAGKWDSTLYLDAEHPKTVAIRMELLDKNTHLPVKGVRVSLEGEYWEAWISQDIITSQEYSSWKVFVDPEKREPQRKEFRLDAVSDYRGMVVFSLGWQKEFPWDSKVGDKWTYTVGDSWIIYFDDIEKIERLEIRHPKYKYFEAPLNFKHIVDLGLYKDTSQYGYSKIRKFEALWQKEVKRKNVRLFVLNLGKNFRDFNKKSCKREEFFRKISAKDYGMVYRKIGNLPNLGDKAKCGPYFAYDLGEILLEPVASQMEIQLHGQRENEVEKKRIRGEEAVRKDEEERNRREEEARKVEEKEKRKNERKESEAEEEGKEEEAEKGKAVYVADKFGLSVIKIGDADRKKLGIPGYIRAVGINYVESGSYADKAGLEAVQIINQLMLRGKGGAFTKKWSIMDMDDYRTYILNRIERGNIFYLEIYRKNSSGKWISDDIKIEIE